MRLLRFHLANGAVGMTTNLALMRLLVDGLGLHYLAANLVATSVAGVTNFLLAGRFVFKPARVLSVGVVRLEAGVHGLIIRW